MLISHILPGQFLLPIVQDYVTPAVVSRDCCLPYVDKALILYPGTATFQWEPFASTSRTDLINANLKLQPSTSRIDLINANLKLQPSRAVPWTTAQRNSQAVAIAQSLSPHMHAHRVSVTVRHPSTVHQQQMVSRTGMMY